VPPLRPAARVDTIAGPRQNKTIGTDDMTIRPRDRFILEGNAWRKGHGSSLYGVDVEMWVDLPYPHLVGIRIERGSRMSEEDFDAKLKTILAAPGATWDVRVVPDRGLVCLITDVTPHPATPEPGPAIDPGAAERMDAFSESVTRLMTRPDLPPLRLSKLMIVACVVGLIDAETETDVEIRNQSVIVGTLTRRGRSLSIAVTRDGAVSNAVSGERMTVDVARNAVAELMSE
jgi:hypothetical protein